MVPPLLRSLSSSIGKKLLMAVTGFCLVGFIIVHLLGNLLAFKSPELFNRYGDTLISMPIIYVAEIILASIFLFHIAMGLTLFIQNSLATPKKYAVKKRTKRGTTWASATMPYTGLALVTLLIIHLIHFKYGANYTIIHSGNSMRDLYRLMVEAYQDPIWVITYVLFVVFIGIHISHGIQSAFQSLGLNHPKYTPIVHILGKVFAFLIAAIFATIPLWFYMRVLQ